MSFQLIIRSPLMELFKRCTVKLLNSSKVFVGTGFFVAPDKIATCYHVFFKNNKLNTHYFCIENYPGDYKLEGQVLYCSDIDVLIIQLPTALSQECLNLCGSSSFLMDKLWAWTYNKKYLEGGGIVPKLREEAVHNEYPVLRISRDIVEDGSSGTPVLNVNTGHLLGLVYWKRFSNAFIIPIQHFQNKFPELFAENQHHHKSTFYWLEAQDNSKKQQYLAPITFISHQDVIGRDADLTTLHQRIISTDKILLLKGVGGLGKTTLVKLYLNYYAEEYDRLFWVEHTGDLIQDIATNTSLLKSLGIEQINGMTAEGIFKQVMLCLQNFNDGLNLLIVDNATQSIRELKDSLPHGPHWHVLLTSREQVSTTFELMELGILSPTAAKELFRLHCSKLQEESALDTFLAQLQYHTLSIELFAKILDAHWELDSVVELSAYLTKRQIDEERLQIVVELEHARGETQLYRHLLSAFDLSGIALRPELLLILQRMAALPPSTEGYPVKDLIEWFSMEKEATAFVNNLLELFKLGWLSQGPKNNFGLHSLVSLIVSKVYPAGIEQLGGLLEFYASRLNFDQFKDNPIDKFTWIPFGQALLDAVDNLEIAEVSNLQNSLGALLFVLGEFSKARILLENAIRTDEQLFGVYSLKTANKYSNLALVLKELGVFDEAKKLLEKVVQIDEQNFGPNHINTAKSYSNLGLLYSDLGEYLLAKSFLEKSLKLEEQYLGIEDPRTSMGYSNLGLIYKELEDYKTAKIYLEKALILDERHYGKNHPNMARIYANIGIVLHKLGKNEDAKLNLEKAIHLNEVNFGVEHPSTARDYANLGLVLQELDDYESAKLFLEKAVKSDEQNFGVNHTRTAEKYTNLGALYANLRNFHESRALLTKAQLIFKNEFGPDHPHTKFVESIFQQLDILESGQH